MESLKYVYDELIEVEGKIMCDLKLLEKITLEHLKNTKKHLKNSPLKNIDLSLNENFGKIESFGNKLKTVADESDNAINGLKKSVNIVETSIILYNSSLKILDYFINENNEEYKEQIEKYIKAVEKAKQGRYWEDVKKVISKGYIGQVISSLKSVTLDSLRTKVSSEQSKLLTKLAVSLDSEKEAYECYLSSVKLESERKVPSNFLTVPGGELGSMNRVIQNSRNLLVRQASSVSTELGPSYFVEICREIHSYASSEATKIFLDFVKHNFGQFISSQTFEQKSSEIISLEDSQSSVENEKDYESVISNLEKILKNSEAVETMASDPKCHKLLDTIAGLASLWTDFETALRESTAPVYANLLVKPREKEFGSDGLMFLSEATKSLQSILSVYVQLQHTFTLKAVLQAIQVSDTIYISQDDNTLTSTLVDDVFFILQKSQQRSIGTGDIQTACATFNLVSAIISNELKTGLMDNLVQSQPIYERWTQKLENLTHGSLYNMLEEHFKRTRGQMPEVVGSKYSFVHSLNNIEECLGLLNKFKQEMTECFSKEFLKDNQEKNLLVDNTIQALDLAKSELEHIMETCCNYSLNMFKDHLTDPLNKFSSLDFQMDEEQYSSSQNEDSFGDFLANVLRVILKHIETYYSPNVGIRCMSGLVEKICKFMETCTLTKKFTIYGAVYFDGAVRGLVYACSNYSKDIRKQFSTLLQISDVLNVNNSDDLMLLRDSDYTIDISKYSSLRTDLSKF